MEVASTGQSLCQIAVDRNRSGFRGWYEEVRVRVTYIRWGPNERKYLRAFSR